MTKTSQLSEPPSVLINNIKIRGTNYRKVFPTKNKVESGIKTSIQALKDQSVLHYKTKKKPVFKLKNLKRTDKI